MNKKLQELLKMDKDERTEGQGFVIIGESEPEDDSLNNSSADMNKDVEKATEMNKDASESKPISDKQPREKTPPVTEKMTDTDDNFFNQFDNNGSGGSGNVPPNYNNSYGSGAGNHNFNGSGNNSGGGNGGYYGGPAYGSASGDPNHRKAGMVNSRNIIIVILALLLGLGAGFGGGILAVNHMSSGSGSSSSGRNYTINANSEELNVTEAVAEKVLPSVVGITATTKVASQDIFSGRFENEVSGVGSGIIVDEAGYILTNSHVIMDDSNTKLTVLLSDGREIEGTVEWFDASLDLAIVKISADNLTAADLGNSDELKVGQYVAAIGNPLGLEFQGSVTQGVVSGLDRTITASSDNKQVRMENLIQVDAAINSGNSGGPLLNNNGQVIGINTAKTESGENMGFAIPINTAKPIVESIKETGEYSRAYMGVSVTNVSDIAQEQNGNLGTETGAYVAQVTPGSPAEAAGLRARDVIVELDGKKIESRNDLINQLLNYSSGDTVDVKYYRNGNQETASVQLTNEIQQ